MHLVYFAYVAERHCNVLLSIVANIRHVCSWYKTSFAQLRSCPVPVDPASEEIFAKVIESIYERHSSTLITMAKGAHELRTIMNHDVAAFADSSDVQKRLDEFYMSRIGIRMVCGSRLFFCSSPLISARLPDFHTRS
jgi:hypothetical protein